MLKMLSNIYVEGGSCSINFTSTSLEILLENPQPPPLFNLQLNQDPAVYCGACRRQGGEGGVCLLEEQLEEEVVEGSSSSWMYYRLLETSRLLLHSSQTPTPLSDLAAAATFLSVEFISFRNLRTQMG